MSFHFLAGSPAPVVRGLLVHGLRDEPDPGAFGIVEQHVEIETAVAFKKVSKVERFSGRGIKVDTAGFVSVDEIRPCFEVPLNLRSAEVSTVPQNKVAFAKPEIRGCGDVVPGVGIDGKVQQSGAVQIEDRLDPRVADARGLVRDSGESREEPGGQFDDGAVLNQNPAVAPESRRGRRFRGVETVDLAADNVFEESFNELEEALIESRTDRLPGQTGPGGVGDRGSQIVVARGAGRAFGQDRADKIGRRDLPGPAFDES